MKTKIPMLLAFLSFVSMTAQQDQTQKNIQLYSSIWDKVLNERQINEINDTNFDQNIIMVSNPENITGIDSFKAYYQNFLTGFSDINFEIMDVFGQGDKIVKHWRFEGKHTGEFFGIPPTGNTVDVEGVTLVKMKNGKIAQEQDFMDNSVFFKQLGLISDPENIEVINKLYENFAAGDVPNVLASMDPNIEWNEAEGNKYADGNPYNGPDAVLNGVFGRIMVEHEYFKLKDVELHEMSNNQVLATLRYDAKWKDGQQYDAQVAHLWTLDDGKITAFQQYVDTKKLADTAAKQ